MGTGEGSPRLRNDEPVSDDPVNEAMLLVDPH